MRKINYLIGIVAASGIISGCGNEEEKYKKCNWGFYENYDDIWKEYMGEKIEHTQNNYHNYIYFIDKVNSGNRIGKIWAPDLDGNGLIREIDSEGNTLREIKPKELISGEELFKKLKK